MTSNADEQFANASNEFDKLLADHAESGGEDGAGQSSPTSHLTDADRARLRKKYSALTQGR